MVKTEEQTKADVNYARYRMLADEQQQKHTNKRQANRSILIKRRKRSWVFEVFVNSSWIYDWKIENDGEY